MSNVLFVGLMLAVPFCGGLMTSPAYAQAVSSGDRVRVQFGGTSLFGSEPTAVEGLVAGVTRDSLFVDLDPGAGQLRTGLSDVTRLFAGQRRKTRLETVWSAGLDGLVLGGFTGTVARLVLGGDAVGTSALFGFYGGGAAAGALVGLLRAREWHWRRVELSTVR